MTLLASRGAIVSTRVHASFSSLITITNGDDVSDVY